MFFCGQEISYRQAWCCGFTSKNETWIVLLQPYNILRNKQIELAFPK